MKTRQAGFTAVEVLVALVIVGIVMTFTLQFFRFQTVSARVENSRRTALSQARSALEFMVRHVSNLGRDPGAQIFTAASPAIDRQDGDRLEYRSNLSADPTDNDTNDPWEDMEFKYDGSSRSVLIEVGGIATALTDNWANQRSYVPAGGLVFTYYDRTGTEIVPGQAAAFRALVRRINISITVRGVAPHQHAEPEVTLTQDVVLHNRS